MTQADEIFTRLEGRPETEILDEVVGSARWDSQSWDFDLEPLTGDPVLSITYEDGTKLSATFTGCTVEVSPLTLVEIRTEFIAALERMAAEQE